MPTDSPVEKLKAAIEQLRETWPYPPDWRKGFDACRAAVLALPEWARLSEPVEDERPDLPTVTLCPICATRLDIALKVAALTPAAKEGK